jgi:hypothetical protein
VPKIQRECEGPRIVTSAPPVHGLKLTHLRASQRQAEITTARSNNFRLTVTYSESRGTLGQGATPSQFSLGEKKKAYIERANPGADLMIRSERRAKSRYCALMVSLALNGIGRMENLPSPVPMRSAQLALA